MVCKQKRKTAILSIKTHTIAVQPHVQDISSHHIALSVFCKISYIILRIWSMSVCWNGMKPSCFSSRLSPDVWTSPSVNAKTGFFARWLALRKSESESLRKELIWDWRWSSSLMAGLGCVFTVLVAVSSRLQNKHTLMELFIIYQI